ncbi:ATP-binding cassette domain-containing protein [Spongiactinospora rosea]|nr:ATP-binding cassette domain-containing protein [Spongiactinospora rosea]
MLPIAVRAEGVRRAGVVGGAEVALLDNVTLSVPRGRFTAVTGPSRSGASMLLRCLGGLDPVNAGRVLAGDVDLALLDEARLARLRRERFGFVAKERDLIPSLTVRQNVTIPAGVDGRTTDGAWVEAVLETTGLAGLQTHRTAEVPPSVWVRIACAKALVRRPEIVFADPAEGSHRGEVVVPGEGIGSGEHEGWREASRVVLPLVLREAATRLGPAVIMATHDPAGAARADTVVSLCGGRVAGVLSNPTTDRVRALVAAGEDGAGGEETPA